MGRLEACSPGQQVGAGPKTERRENDHPPAPPVLPPSRYGHPALPTISYVPSQTHAGRCRSLIRSCQPPQLASAIEPSSSRTASPPEMRPGRSSSVTEPVAVSRGPQVFDAGFANHALRESRNLLDSVGGDMNYLGAQTPPGNSPPQPLSKTIRRQNCRIDHETALEYWAVALRRRNGAAIRTPR